MVICYQPVPESLILQILPTMCGRPDLMETLQYLSAILVALTFQNQYNECSMKRAVTELNKTLDY